MMQKLEKIARQFNIPCDITTVSRMGEGFINDTLRVETPMGCRDYILQRKNKHIFGDIPAMMENIRAVTGHLREVTSHNGGDSTREVLTQIPLRDNMETIGPCANSSPVRLHTTALTHRQ